MIDSRRAWLLSRQCIFTNIGYIFSGYGHLLIEADSLMNYLFKGENFTFSTLVLENFFKNLQQSGMHNYRLIFFLKYSKWASNTLGILKTKVKICTFESWCDPKWLKYLSEENVGLILTTKCEVFNEPEIQYDFIYNVCNIHQIQVILIDKLQFEDMKMYCSLITPDKEIKIEAKKIPILETESFSLKKLEANNFKIYNIKNESIKQILNYEHSDMNNNQGNYPVIDKVIFNNNYETDFLWDLKIPKKDNPFIKNKEKHIQAQKYYKYMEIYATSLDECKDLHHPIITNIDAKNTSKKSIEKKSNKAEEIIRKNIESKLKQKEEKQIQTLRNLEIYCYDDIDRLLKDTVTKEFAKNSLLELKKLRFKWLKLEPDSNPKKKLKLFLLITEIFENDKELLSEEEKTNLLRCLKEQGFESTCKYLTKGEIKDLKDTFNHDSLFQLKYCGEYLPRTLDSIKDSRVRFTPDKWQKDLLDIVDRRESALICCPTSSGKTFISYYAMEQALRNSHDDVVVFLAPLKSLANQVAAEVYARFSSKTYSKNHEKSVYAMSMQDFVINDPLKCQILITLPTVFEGLICEKSNLEWVKKIKYVVLDEIQTLNEADIGPSIERIIHLIQCPILVLSATIGNLDDFYSWLKDIHDLKGIKINKIVQRERFCDLKKYAYKQKTRNLEPELIGVHELFGYSEKCFINDDLSEDFHLLPGEIVEILDSLEKICTSKEKKELFNSVQPDKFFKNVILNKKVVKEYEGFLINKLKLWFRDEIFEASEVGLFFSNLNKNAQQAVEIYEKNSKNDWSKNNLYDLVKKLYDSKMLPAIVFLNSSDECDRLATALTQHLIELEKMDKDYEYNDKLEEKLLKEIKRTRDDKKKKDEDRIEEPCLILPLVDRTKHTFLDPKFRLADSEINDEIDLHKYRKIPDILFEAWKRGIGVHHSVHNVKFRSSVECLFRKKHLQIVFATRSLSLGINMPCKTVVIPSDSIYFNPIYYRHMVGRAGRRGFDNIGNIVFYGVPKTKIKNFISSKISNIRGSFTLSLNFLTQISAMQIYNNQTMRIFESFIKNPIIRLSISEFDLKTCQKTTYTKIQYLISKFYLDSNFNPHPLKIKCLILLRNENVHAIILIEFIQSEYFDKILNKYNNLSIEGMADLICLIFCHFLSTRFFEWDQAKQIENSMINIVLPEIDELKEFLIKREKELESFISFFINDNENLELYKKGFPSSLRLVMAKNSYIYDYYIGGNIDAITKRNCVFQVQLWHAMRALRYTSKALYPLFLTKEIKIRESFSCFSKKVDEQFWKITN